MMLLCYVCLMCVPKQRILSLSLGGLCVLPVREFFTFQKVVVAL